MSYGLQPRFLFTSLLCVIEWTWLHQMACGGILTFWAIHHLSSKRSCQSGSRDSNVRSTLWRINAFWVADKRLEGPLPCNTNKKGRRASLGSSPGSQRDLCSQRAPILKLTLTFYLSHESEPGNANGSGQQDGLVVKIQNSENEQSCSGTEVFDFWLNQYFFLSQLFWYVAVITMVDEHNLPNI